MQYIFISKCCKFINIQNFKFINCRDNYRTYLNHTSQHIAKRQILQLLTQFTSIHRIFVYAFMLNFAMFVMMIFLLQYYCSSVQNCANTNRVVCRLNQKSCKCTFSIFQGGLLLLIEYFIKLNFSLALKSALYYAGVLDCATEY